MHIGHVNKPSPIGCVIGLIGLITMSFSALLFWGVYKAYTAEPPAADTGRQLLSCAVYALIPAVLCTGFCIYRILTVGQRETRSTSRFFSTGV